MPINYYLIKLTHKDGSNSYLSHRGKTKWIKSTAKNYLIHFSLNGCKGELEKFL